MLCDFNGELQDHPEFCLFLMEGNTEQIVKSIILMFCFIIMRPTQDCFYIVTFNCKLFALRPHLEEIIEKI